jgi:hypothetical protein
VQHNLYRDSISLAATAMTTAEYKTVQKPYTKSCLNKIGEHKTFDTVSHGTLEIKVSNTLQVDAMIK